MYAKRRRTNSGGVKGTFASPAYVRSVNRKYSAPRAAARVTPTFVTSRRYARIRRISDQEKKYLDTAVAAGGTGAGLGIGNDMTAAEKVIDLAIIPRGTGVNQRIGKTVRITGVQLRGTAVAITAAGAVGGAAQFALVWDSEPDQAAAVPLDSDIFWAPTSIIPTLSNRDNAPRFRVLKKWIWEIPPFTTAGGATSEHVFTINETLSFKKKDLKIMWNAVDTDGLTSQKVKGNLLFVTSANRTEAVLSAQWANGGLISRVDFDDK